MQIKKIFYFIVFGLLLSSTAHAQLTMPNTSNEGVEAQVSALFADAPEMVAIAQCESGFRQFTGSGAPLAGGAGGNYVGVFQISAGHNAEALSLGWNIYTTEGNLAYANYLYQKQGTEPWSSCISAAAKPQTAAILLASSTPQTATSIPVSSRVTGTLTLNLNIGMVNPEVITLQQLLNAAGFAVASSGPGSVGNETNKFGALTLQAVQRFQCAKNITCSGSAATTGYGRVGPITRAALLATE